MFQSMMCEIDGLKDLLIEDKILLKSYKEGSKH